MKRSNLTLTFIILSLLLSFSVAANNDSSYNKVVYNAFVTRDMPKWEGLIRTMEASNNTKTVEQKLELINYYYGYIGYLLTKKKYDETDKLIDRGEKLIDQVLKMSPKNATAYSFKGSFSAFKIGIHRLQTPFLALEAKRCVNKALQLDPQNIQGLIDKGTIYYYSPGMMGGDKKKALECYLKCVSIIEKNKNTDENWLYIKVLTLIASAYDKTDNQLAAKQTYEKILRLDPNIIWVKNDLNKLLAKMKS